MVWNRHSGINVTETKPAIARISSIEAMSVTQACASAAVA